MEEQEPKDVRRERRQYSVALWPETYKAIDAIREKHETRCKVVARAIDLLVKRKRKGRK